MLVIVMADDLPKKAEVVNAEQPPQEEIVSSTVDDEEIEIKEEEDTMEEMPEEDEEEDEDEEFHWTPYDELMLLHSLYPLRPVGPAYHFLVMVIWQKFMEATGKSLSLAAVKRKLDTYYNFKGLKPIIDDYEASNEDFQLPSWVFPEPYRPAAYRLNGARAAKIAKILSEIPFGGKRRSRQSATN